MSDIRLTSMERDRLRAWLQQEKSRARQIQESDCFYTVLKRLDEVDSEEESHAYAMRHDP